MNFQRPIVVLVAEASARAGGIATFTETVIANARLAERFEIRLLNTARPSTREGGKFTLSNVWSALADASRTWRSARGADVVHLQLVADPGLPALRAAALTLAAAAGRAKVIAHIHSAVGNAGRPEFGGYGWLDRIALSTLRRCDFVCTVSDAGTATMRGLAGRTPVQKVDNAVDLAHFPVTPADRVPPTVLFMGLICRRKGTIELARAARQLHKTGIVDWNLVVVGDQGATPQQEYEEILAEFAAAELSDSLVGPEYGTQIRTRLKNCDVFVLPSYLEGQPIAIIEAMASGVPVVGSSTGGVPGLIRDGIEGRLVEPGDVAGLARVLGELITAPATRATMGESARRRAEQLYSVDTLSDRLGDVYLAVLDDNVKSSTKETATQS